MALSINTAAEKSRSLLERKAPDLLRLLEQRHFLYASCPPRRMRLALASLWIAVLRRVATTLSDAIGYVDAVSGNIPTIVDVDAAAAQAVALASIEASYSAQASAIETRRVAAVADYTALGYSAKATGSAVAAFAASATADTAALRATADAAIAASTAACTTSAEAAGARTLKRVSNRINADLDATDADLIELRQSMRKRR